MCVSSLVGVAAIVVVTIASAPFVSVVFDTVLAVVLGICEYAEGTFIIALSSIGFANSDCVLAVTIGSLGFAV